MLGNGSAFGADIAPGPTAVGGGVGADDWAGAVVCGAGEEAPAGAGGGPAAPRGEQAITRAATTDDRVSVSSLIGSESWSSTGGRHRGEKTTGERPFQAATPVVRILGGQGEIRTLDTGFTGMPVFETGAFSHSATCPGEPYKLDRRRWSVNDLATRAEELREQFSALRSAYSGKHLRPVIEARMP